MCSLVLREKMVIVLPATVAIRYQINNIFYYLRQNIILVTNRNFVQHQQI